MLIKLASETLINALVAWLFLRASLIIFDCTVRGSNFHLSRLQGIVRVTRPSSPVDAIGVARVEAAIIETVQIGRMAGSIPPCTFEALSTVQVRRVVIILVVGAKGLPCVVPHSIAWMGKQIEA